MKINRVFVIEKRLNEASIETMKHLGSANILPQDLDDTVEKWLYRISLWGKLKFAYQKPTSRIRSFFGGKEKITQKKFVDLMLSNELSRMFGKWTAVKTAANKMYCEREFVDLDSKRKVERLYVEIELNPEVKKVLNN